MIRTDRENLNPNKTKNCPFSHPIHIFVLSASHPPIIQCRTQSGSGGRRPQGKWSISYRHRKLAAAAGWRSVPQLFHALVDFLLQSGFWFCLGEVQSSRDHCHPYPTSHSPAMLLMGRKGLNPSKTHAAIFRPRSSRPVCRLYPGPVSHPSTPNAHTIPGLGCLIRGMTRTSPPPSPHLRE